MPASTVTSPVPIAVSLPRAPRPTMPSGADASHRRASFSPPELGAKVRFQRSATHHPEIGVVRSRQFGTGIIEIADKDNRQIRLERGDYEVIENAV